MDTQDSMRPIMRLVALVACTLLVFAACNGDQPEVTPEPTETPTATPSVASLGEFQLVARIEQAFLNISPVIEPPSEVTQPLDPGAEQQAAGVGGVMRGVFEAFSDNLKEQCNADEGDRFNLYWTSGTLFDQTLTRRSLELTLDGRRIGLVGSIFRAPTAAPDTDEFDFDETAEPTATAPTGTPASSPGSIEETTDCILVVEEVGISQSGALPTARPTGSPRRTATPTPEDTLRPTPTPRRTATPTPTESEDPTASPTEEPTEEPTESPDEETD